MIICCNNCLYFWTVTIPFIVLSKFQSKQTLLLKSSGRELQINFSPDRLIQINESWLHDFYGLCDYKWIKTCMYFQTMKDNCNPVYDETFEYILSQGELNSRQLEVSVVTRKGWFSSHSPVMGQVCDIAHWFPAYKQNWELKFGTVKGLEQTHTFCMKFCFCLGDHVKLVWKISSSGNLY